MVSLSDQILLHFAIDGVHCNADNHADMNLVFGDDEWLRERGNQLASDRYCDFHIEQLNQKDGEFISAKPGNRVGFSYRRPQSFTDCLEQAIADIVS